MKTTLTLTLVLTCGLLFGQPKLFTIKEANEHIANEQFYFRVPLKWMPDSCRKILAPINCKVYYSGGLNLNTSLYDSIMELQLKNLYDTLWTNAKKNCEKCFMTYYAKYQGLYDLDGDLLDPNTATRHIKQGKLYYLVFGELDTEYLPSGFNECEKKVYESYGLKVKWLGSTTVQLAEDYNRNVFHYLDSINGKTNSYAEADSLFRLCLDTWDKK